MKTLAKMTGLLALLIILGASSAGALTLNFDSITNSVIQFNGANSTFQFLPEPAPPPFEFQITSQTGGAGLALGLFGNIAGLFTIGPITQIIPGVVETALVAGSGTLTIAADQPFTAALQWVSIITAGAGGTLDFMAQANLFPVAYGGANPDLQAFLVGGITTATFQFTSVIPLTTLAQGGALNSTSYSGSMSPIPLPASVLLLGSGLLGLVGFGLRRKQG